MRSTKNEPRRRYGLADRMGAEDFRFWLLEMDLSDRDAAYVLRVSRNSVARYKVDGAPCHIGLACMALYLGLKPFGVATATLQQSPFNQTTSVWSPPQKDQLRQTDNVQVTSRIAKAFGAD